MSRLMSFILLLLVVAVVLFFNVTKETSITAMIANSSDIFSNEEEFNEPVDIEWTGRIIATMSGGTCVGLQDLSARAGKIDRYSKFIACLPELYSKKLNNYSGIVTINGEWLGITCAYKNTIFGECVPEVLIKDINQAVLDLKNP